jgi:anti-sigma factor RsiW
MTQTTHLTPDALNAFIDGELSAGEAESIQQHLTECHQCTLRVLSATQLKAATARSAQRFTAPPEALARLTAQFSAQQAKKPAQVIAFRPLAWSALAAAIVLAVSLLGWRQVHQSNTLAAELLDQHLATLSSGVEPEVISSDRHTVKPWFQGRLPFSFNLPEPDALPADTVLKGADLTYIDHQPAALLLFTIHKHEVSVFITQRTGISPPAPSANRSGFAIYDATTPDLRLVAVSDVNPSDLDLLLAALVRAQSTH